MPRVSKNVVVSGSLASSLSEFSGNEDEKVEIFLDQINDVANLEKWSSEKKLIILKLNLKGKALKFAAEYLEDNKDDLKGLELELKKKFKRSINFEDTLKEFNNLNQNPSEKIKDYAERVEKVTQNYVDPNKSKEKQVEDLAKKLKFSKFVETVRPEIRVEIKKLGAKDFAEAVKIAKNVEEAFEDLEVIEINNINKSENLELKLLMENQFEANKNIQILTEKINELQQQRPSTSQNFNASQNFIPPNRSVSCHICGKNHITTDCWYFPQTNHSRQQNNNFRNFRRTFNRGANTQNRDFANSNFKAKNRGQFRGRRPYDRSQNRNLNL